MNPCKAIHETIIKDIVDILLDVKDMDEMQFALGKNKSFKSISSATANLICVFPVVVDRSMSIESAQMATKAYERDAVAMLQMLFSAFTITDAKNAKEYLSKFHTNMNLSGSITMDNFVDMVDQIADKLDEASGISLDREVYDVVKEDLKNLNFYLEDYESINDTPISSYKVMPKSKIFRETTVINEAKGKPGRNGRRNNSNNNNWNSAGQNSTQTRNINQNITTHNYNHNDGETTQRKINVSVSSQDQKMKNYADFYKNQVLDTDIKKSNELMPTLMVINFLTPTDDGSDVINVNNAVIGVKAKMYPADPTDIIERIASKNKDNNGLNNFIRATTREISFWKDFVFAIDRAKLDAISTSRRGSSSPIWKLLERRALKSRLRRTFRMANDATAITALAISQNTAEALKIQENINIENPGTARSIMDSFNLMEICIMDEALEIGKFIKDNGDDIYEEISFSSLERESSDGTYKKVVNLMTKMR